MKSLTQSVDKSKQITPNYKLYLFATCFLGGILVYVSPVFIPLVLISGIVSYRMGINGFHNKMQIYDDYIEKLIHNMEQTNYHVVANMQVGVAVFGNHARLQWYNNKFQTIVQREQITGLSLETILNLEKNAFETLTSRESGRRIVTLKDKVYSMEYKRLTDYHAEKFKTGKEDKNSANGLAVYLYDYTDIFKLQKKYAAEKLALCCIRCDNYEEVSRSLSDGGIVALNGAVNGMLTKWANKYHGFIVSISRDSSLVGFYQNDLKQIIANKFAILDSIHSINAGGRLSPTLSIGVAITAIDLNELLDKAQHALDLALNRGGDQAVLDNNGRLSYFGATGAITIKATRVRARIMAQALREYMEKADNILIMGHTREDFDAIGAAIGVAAMARFLNKPVYLAMASKEGEFSRLHNVLVKMNINNPYNDLIMNWEEASDLITSKTLLILVDHHRRQLSSIPDLVDAVGTKIVIDHHRRSEYIIPHLPLLYQEPSSSSTSELVTEFFPYFDEDLELTQLEATCLYNGILLDTKQFTVQTSERTFEAAAYLRRTGANLAVANELFADSLEDLTMKAQLLAGAKMLLKNFAITFKENVEKKSRSSILAAQAADELLRTLDVKGAAVILKFTDGSINISARSDGNYFNVQVMMEALGGGGHQQAAAVQIKNKTLDEVKNQLFEEVKKQMED